MASISSQDQANQFQMLQNDQDAQPSHILQEQNEKLRQTLFKQKQQHHLNEMQLREKIKIVQAQFMKYKYESGKVHDQFFEKMKIIIQYEKIIQDYQTKQQESKDKKMFEDNTIMNIQKLYIEQKEENCQLKQQIQEKNREINSLKKNNAQYYQQLKILNHQLTKQNKDQLKKHTSYNKKQQEEQTILKLQEKLKSLQNINNQLKQQNNEQMNKKQIRLKDQLIQEMNEQECIIWGLKNQIKELKCQLRDYKKKNLKINQNHLHSQYDIKNLLEYNEVVLLSIGEEAKKKRDFCDPKKLRNIFEEAKSQLIEGLHKIHFK